MPIEALDLPEGKVPVYSPFLIFGAVIGFAVLLIWAYTFDLDIVSTAKGVVIPSGQVKQVQHLEGGIVEQILVREGESVGKGQKLVILESISSGADLGEMEGRVAFLEVEIVRLEAEASGKEALVYPDHFRERFPELTKELLKLFISRQSSLVSDRAVQNQLIKQRRQDIKEIKARRRNLKKSESFISEQITISEKLLEDDLTNRFNHLDLLKQQSATKVEIDGLTEALGRANAALAEAEEQLKKITHSFQEEARQNLELARHELKQLKTRRHKYRDNLERTAIRSPVDGTIKTLHVHTKGGIVKAGGMIVEIVPTDERLIVEALLLPQDVGYVQPGHYAFVRLASAEAMRFEKLDGEVIHVSPDTFIAKSGNAFYKVRIVTEKDYFERQGMTCQLVPGMQVMANIRIGTRTVLEYVLGPFMASMGGVLTER